MTPPSSSARAGVSLVEVVVSMLLTAFLVQLAWWAAASARRTADRVVARGEALETARVMRHVLVREASAGIGGRDWAVEQRRTLTLRAFRGIGEVCGPLSHPGEGLLRYRGARLADPAKDSLLVLSTAGEWHVVRLVDRAASGLGCPGWGEEPLERWRWDPPVEGAVIARVFERGSYHLEDRALRYRVGAGGRQPLTAERVDHAGSTLTWGGGSLSALLRVTIDETFGLEWTGVLWRWGHDGS